MNTRTALRGAIVLLAIITISSVNALSIDARRIIGNVQDRYESINDAVLTFTQTVRFKVARAEQTSKGTLYFKKPNKYRIETEDRTVVTDGVTSWSYNSKNRQLVVDNYKAETHSLSPEQLLLQYPKDFFSTLVGEEQLASHRCYVLTLTPKEDNSFATGMKIWVSRDWLIRKVEINDINGATTIYGIESIATDQKLPDTRFAYQVPDNAEVIDLR